MTKRLISLWNDENGFIVSAELILVSTILVIGMVVGLQTIRETVTTEMADVAAAIGSLNQSYNFGGMTGASSSIAGSSFVDYTDFCDATAQNTAGGQQCVGIIFAATPESGS
jgi:hypothetical protein